MISFLGYLGFRVENLAPFTLIVTTNRHAGMDGRHPGSQDASETSMSTGFLHSMLE